MKNVGLSLLCRCSLIFFFLLKYKSEADNEELKSR